MIGHLLSRLDLQFCETRHDHPVIYLPDVYGRLFAFLRREQVNELLLVELHKGAGDRKTEFLPHFLDGLEYIMNGAWYDAHMIIQHSIEGRAHGVGLARARLSVRKDGDIVAVQQLLHLCLHAGLEELLLGVSNVEDMVVSVRLGPVDRDLWCSVRRALHGYPTAAIQLGLHQGAHAQGHGHGTGILAGHLRGRKGLTIF